MAEKTIIEKLNLDSYTNPIIINPIQDNLVDELKAKTATFENTDFMLIFVKNISELKQYFEQVNSNNYIRDNGLLAFAYAKKGNKLYDTYVHRDEIFPALGVDDDGYPTDSLLKFNRMVKYDDNFTLVALKKTVKHEVYIKDGRVDDYKKYIPELKKRLSGKAKEFYEQLMPGYQRDWARYIYSAKTNTTQEKHFEEMKQILEQGFKSRELYRQGKK